jgi:uncharacterized repeat protein (TIGR03803 family)
MKNHGKFPAVSLLIAALVAAVMFAGAVRVAGQTDSISSTPSTITFKTLVNFDGTNGADPQLMSLVQGFDGTFYGTTAEGGSQNSGTVFKITAAGNLITPYSFCSETNCTDGEQPYAGLVQATDGNFYGSTVEGGGSSQCSQGCGTVFKITPSGTLTTLHSFDVSDGAYPVGALVQATDGTFYGTTYGAYPEAKSANIDRASLEGTTSSYGTIFKVTRDGTLITLHTFCSQNGCADGYYPAGALVQATDGNFYGTTEYGGASSGGTIFKIAAGGMLTTLYSFCSQTNCTDGAHPIAGLVQATNGIFYGTTYTGGANGFGTVFKITAAGNLTTLYSFCSETNCTDGSGPLAGLVQATDEKLYGTTGFGANDNNNCLDGCGTVFNITPEGTLTTIHSFAYSDGDNPFGGLVQATSGEFYGTTLAGGTNGSGTAFSLSVGLRKFVETRPTSGKPGAAVIILGTDLKHATGVTFNGARATFKIVSKSEIKTNVPEGATTGKVKVSTASGTLTSNLNFRVP